MFLVFGLFTATAQAGLLAPTISVSPSGTNVSNGDTVTFTVVAHCTLGLLSSDSCQFNNSSLPTNVTFTTVSGVLNVDSTITSTLTISNASAADAGTYTVKFSDLLGLLTGNASASVTLGVIPAVTAVPTQTGMVANKGFKLQFSGPTGSNLVVQATSDMKSWTSLSTNVIVNGSVTYTDAAATTVSCRFYRAKLQ